MQGQPGIFSFSCVVFQRGILFFIQCTLFLVIAVGLLLSPECISHSYAQSVQKTPVKGPSLDPKGDVLEFGNLLAHHQSYTIEDIIVTHGSQRSIPVQVRVLGLRHDKTNFALNPENWCTITPSQASVSSNYPLKFNFKVSLPQDMPAGIPDGLYRGTLLIKSAEAVQAKRIPFRFTLNLPDFATIPEGLAESGVQVAMNCCLPDTQTFSLQLTSDADQEQEVRVITPLILVNEKTEASVASEKAGITILPEQAHQAGITIPAGEPKETTYQARVNTDNMNPGTYTGDITVRSDLGRTLYIPFRLTIPATFLTEDIARYSLIAAFGFLGIWVVWPSRRLYQGRNRFQGGRFHIRNTGGNIRMPAPWRDILSADYLPNQNVWQITSRGGYQVSSSRPDPYTPPGTVNVTQTQGSNFTVNRGPERYELRIPSTTSSMLLNVRITQSPFHRGRIVLSWLFLLALAGICLWSSQHPEIWCRFL